MPPMTLVALEHVTVTHGTRTLIDDVTVGVTENAHIGVVGRNGGGKSTLLAALLGERTPDSGRAVRGGGVRQSVLHQEDDLDPTATVRRSVVGERPTHEWAGDPAVRAVLVGLLGGEGAPLLPDGLETVVGTLSGGQRRRTALAAALVRDVDLLVLDEPTNHLDLEAIHWLGEHLAARRHAVVVVTHDRWFLDRVCDQTWEVASGKVHRYDGGYAAYVLAKAERSRVEVFDEERRNNLLRKELAWLRRGPPARTSKPKFRIDAANALIADEPPARDKLELQRFATARLGKKVAELEEVTLAPAPGTPAVLTGATWRLGPGDRVGLLGPNGVGKTTLLRLIAGLPVEVLGGRIEMGQTVQVALLSQTLVDLPAAERVLPWLESVRTNVAVGDKMVSASSLLEGFGFAGERLRTRIGDLSGGERRRLQLLRLLVEGPNVLLLDEPTNDLDVETLTVLEDLLDTWPGTVIVVSHDRFFLERVTDDVVALLGDGRVRHLPGGVEEYLRLRTDGASTVGVRGANTRGTAAPQQVAKPSADLREMRKELTRTERTMGKLADEEGRLHVDLERHATDHAKVLELDARLRALVSERGALEERWLELATELED